MSVRTRTRKKGKVKAPDATPNQAKAKTTTTATDEVSVATAKVDLMRLLAATQAHFDSAAERYLEADARIRAEDIEKHDVDFSGKEKLDKEKLADAGVDTAKDYLTDQAIDKGKELAEHAEVGAEGVPVVGWAVSLAKAGNKWVKEIFNAKHSKARRHAQRQVITAARKDMKAWIAGVTAQIEAAETVDELRTIGQTEIIPMLSAVQNEVTVVAELQAYVLKLETSDPSFTSTEKMDTIREDRTGLGPAIVEQATE